MVRWAHRCNTWCCILFFIACSLLEEGFCDSRSLDHSGARGSARHLRREDMTPVAVDETNRGESIAMEPYLQGDLVPPSTQVEIQPHAILPTDIDAALVQLDSTSNQTFGLAPAPPALPAPPPPLSEDEALLSYRHWLKQRSGSAFAVEIGIRHNTNKTITNLNPEYEEVKNFILQEALKNVIAFQAQEGDPAFINADVQVKLFPKIHTAHVVINMPPEVKAVNVAKALLRALNQKRMFEAQLSVEEGMKSEGLEGWRLGHLSPLKVAPNVNVECVEGGEAEEPAVPEWMHGQKAVEEKQKKSNLWPMGRTTFETCRNACSLNMPWASSFRPYASFQFSNKHARFDERVEGDCACVKNVSVPVKPKGFTVTCGAPACQAGRTQNKQLYVIKSHQATGFDCRAMCKDSVGYQMTDMEALFSHTVTAACACLTDAVEPENVQSWSFVADKVPVICSSVQFGGMSVSGGYSGKDIEKIKQHEENKDKTEEEKAETETILPGCYVRMASGCPKKKWFKSLTWQKDADSKSQTDKYRCKNVRPDFYKDWCGSDEVETKFIGTPEFGPNPLQQGSLKPGCYVMLPSGCPKNAWFKATEWQRDQDPKFTSNTDRNRCEKEREKSYSTWCGTSDVKVLYIQDPFAVPATAALVKLTDLTGDAAGVKLVPLTQAKPFYEDVLSTKFPDELPSIFVASTLVRMKGSSQTGSFGFTIMEDAVVFILLRCNRKETGPEDEERSLKPAIVRLERSSFVRSKKDMTPSGFSCDPTFNKGMHPVFQKAFAAQSRLDMTIPPDTPYVVFVKRQADLGGL